MFHRLYRFIMENLLPIPPYTQDNLVSFHPRYWRCLWRHTGFWPWSIPFDILGLNQLFIVRNSCGTTPISCFSKYTDECKTVMWLIFNAQAFYLMSANFPEQTGANCSWLSSSFMAFSTNKFTNFLYVFAIFLLVL